MQIFFHTKEVELDEREEKHIRERLEKLNKFFSPSVQYYVNLEKTRGDLKGDDLYEASIKVDDPPHHYFADDRKDSVLKAFDAAYNDLFRLIRKDRGKARAMLKAAGRKIKKMLRMR